MPKWEHKAVGWAFIGAHADGWPGQPAYAVKLDVAREAQGGQFASAIVGDRLEDDQDADDQYLAWRDDEENAYLNAMGAAGFELVSVYRHVHVSSGRNWPLISVRAYFKRQDNPDNPEPPRPIGFRRLGGP